MSDTTFSMPTMTRSAATEHRHRRSLPTLDLFGIAGLASINAIHVTELGGKVDEVAYLGAGYVALTAAAFVAIVMFAVGDHRAWKLAGATAAATLVGFILTRTTGLPGSTSDIGNWTETLAVWAMVSEVGVVLLAAVALLRQRRAA
jgi:hypothetical protein